MIVKFRTNLWDILQANFYMVPRSRTYRIFGVILLGVIGYLSYYEASSPELPSVPAQIMAFVITFLLSLGAALSVMALLLLVILSIGFLFNAKKQSRECTLTATAKGIKLETSVDRSDMYWSEVQKISKTDRHVFILVSDGGVIIVPQRAFAEPGKGKQFYETITALWNSNKNTPHE